MLPPVYSTTVPPGRSRPSRSAAAIIASAMRSFMLPVGFSHSSFTKTRAQPAGTTRRSSTIGVLPIASRTLLDEFIGGPSRSPVRTAHGVRSR